MNLQKLMSKTRQAMEYFHMIEAGDCIAVGLSGGKDSLALLMVLAGLRRYYPVPFSIVGITVDLGFVEMDFSDVASLCERLEVPYVITHTQIREIVFDVRKEKNPCSLCAKLRKGALNEEAKRFGCNKIAFAHHKDDFIETMFLSLIHEGYFSVFPPVKYWDKAEMTVIRPFVFTEEKDIRAFQRKEGLPVVENLCPADGNTKREYVKQLLREINRETPGAKERMFHAIMMSEEWRGWKDAGKEAE